MARFSEWLSNLNLRFEDGSEVSADKRAAAMWAAREPVNFETARAAGSARTFFDCE